MTAAKHSRGICILVLVCLLTGCTARQSATLSPSGNALRSEYTSGDVSAISQVERNGALITPPVLRAGEGLSKAPIGGLIAYSLKAAEARLLASGGEGDWRRRDPELFTLAGITRPEGVVVDETRGDIILIGHAEEDDAPLTLDDFVVALRARWIEGKWPVVSIDPIPGKPLREGDPQTVRFEGGIQNTQFGADLLDADHSLKRMAFGVLPIGVPGLTSQFERLLDRSRSGVTAQAKQIGVRFWFEPVQDRVIVRDGVVQLGPMSISVFTEVLSASVGGNTVDPKSYHDEDSDAFARDISNRFDDVARAHPTVARVRGLNGIVAVVAGLERIDDKPSLDYWLRQYAVRAIQTPPTVRVLRREEKVRNGSTESKAFAEGGVQLQAIALALQSGDVSALRRAVLAVRPEPMAVSWRLIIGQWVIPLSAGALPPSAVGPLYAQAAFLSGQHRWDDVIATLNTAVGLRQSGQEAKEDLSAAFNYRGDAYDEKGQHDRAIEDYDQAIRLNPKLADAFNNRGRAYGHKGQDDRAIQDFDQAVRLNPNLSVAFYNRGLAYADKGQYDRAIQDDDRAIQLAPDLADAFNSRGLAYSHKGQQDRAMKDYDQAIRLNPSHARAFTNRGVIYRNRGQYDRAIQDYDQAIRLDPNLAEAFGNRGTAYGIEGQYDRAIEDLDQAIRLKPKLAEAFNNRGNAYVLKGQYDRAIQDLDQAIRLDANDATAFYNRGKALSALGLHAQAAADFAKARQLNPNLPPPL